MKRTIILVFVVSLSFIIANASHDHSGMFAAATPLEITKDTKGHLNETYDVDCFYFKAPEQGYYTFLGLGQTELRAHLYDADFFFLRSGEQANSHKGFIIAHWLEAGEEVYVKVDSSVRESQDYSIEIKLNDLPFNRIVPGQTKVIMPILPNQITTIRVPISFYKNNIRLSDVSKAYAYMLNVKATGLIEGQAVFNTEKYELEFDIYGETDAVVNVSVGGNISCDIAINTYYDPALDSGESSNQQDKNTSGVNEDNNYINNKKDKQEENNLREPEIHKGDCNLDNKVDIVDVASLLDVVSLSGFTQEQFNIADVTGNGVVDLTDALLILRRATGASR